MEIPRVNVSLGDSRSPGEFKEIGKLKKEEQVGLSSVISNRTHMEM